jgi:serine/threonine protein kinase/flagellar motor protein MotB
MSIVVVELEGILARTLKDAWSSLAAVRTVPAKDALTDLARDPPDLIVVPEQLSKGSGFGLVNRMRRMEALGPARIILVSIDGTQDALDHHQAGATPASAYLLAPGGSEAALADLILDTAGRLFPGKLSSASPASIPEVDPDDVEEVVEALDKGDSLEDALAGVVERLGGYRVLRRLRDENGGAVFACMDDELDRPVAVKILPPSDKQDDEVVQRFLRERQVLAVINSPHVLQVYGAGTHEGCPYLVRELLVGESLQDMIADGPLEVDDALRWTRETALALKHAFDAGVVHRDVCPENIYIVDDHVRLARFNAGRFVSAREHQITMPEMRVVHQVYAAPERVMGGGDDRSDIYSLGVTLHTLLAGRPPFQTSRPVDIVTGNLKEDPVPLSAAREGIRDDVAALVARMMAPRVEDRPGSWRDVLVELNKLCSTTDAPPQRTAPPVEDDDPSGIHGTLRRMGVIDLVQTLEMSRKTATVSLIGADGAEGVLAFTGGQLIHAAWAGEVGEQAFFDLIGVGEGTFNVAFHPVTHEQNIHRPTTGLLLEALRLRDEGSAAEPTPSSLPPPPEGLGNSDFFAAQPAPSSSGFTDLGELDDDTEDDTEHEDDEPPPPSWKARRVHSWLGYAAIVAVIALAGWGGSQLPSILPAPAPEDLSDFDKLIDAQRTRIDQLEDELEKARPALVAATAEDEETKGRQEVVAAVAKHLGELLAPDVEERRVRVRIADDQEALVVELSSDVVFGGQTAVATPDGEALLGRVSTAIKSLRFIELRIEAHSDDRAPPEASGHANNWSITGAQAQGVLAVFKKLGWKRGQVSYAARAEIAPLQSNAGPRGRARNRRLDLVVTPKTELLERGVLGLPSTATPTPTATAP